MPYYILLMLVIMLVLNLKRLIEMRGVKNLRAYLVNHGFTQGEARNLVSGKTQLLRFSLGTRLCEVFDCTPNDLLDWTGDPTHPLAAISKSKAPDIWKLLENKSPEELEEILRKLSE